MNAEGVRAPPLRGYRRRKAALDLNMVPSENRDHEGTSSQIEAQPVQTSQRQPVPPARIDVDAIDDDVIESSPGAFAEATKNSRRNRRRIALDVDSGQTTFVADIPRVKRARVPKNQTNICCELYINYDTSRKSKRDDAINVAEPSPPLPPAPKEPTFTCPICFGPLVEEMSTKCGHIFCKECIKTAIGKQAKCPTCRKKVTVKELIRVFLPAAN
ncbi:E3 ubiquitin-protein ligase RNF4 isoform X2 [Tripterygium wilfordii]|uniref:E3 ubiquitin-protein ligase RNF4 isoform X2 n=1 Tax=Tripterygium wilfordii TaxID=458696 RepID=A0A7J7D4L4_TRIWF|nr:E3 ubiquitin-protein ligase RNF4-like [Tripterygium wilfordii]XP_038713866.1 E3 ubiquitin-protein ligase RNF4-like [Tripterygium wilfordii]XP_038713867.1 E3 ubiquitin-protein ligase RNF4-like [Tripterygium wilfordii]XP_038713868.1 E3 ubiquitin-protein ligase RNF4-like [Tripterygium wilfordii]KAF5741280.1 E3 ubiquitin-protein ligase RNF4 isoform X2 [Tripterygium wilfordii]